MVTLRFNHENKEWINVSDEERQDVDVQLPNLLIEKLDKVKKDLKNDMDVMSICVGGVGTGKSTLMRLCCRYVSDEKFNPREHIIQDVNDIKSVMMNAKPGDAILIDESSGIFSSSDTLTKKTKYANLVLDVCRQKNLFIAAAAPYFHRLGASIAVDRARFLLRVYLHKKTGKRGNMCYYSEKRKEKLYHYSKKNMGAINGVKPNWRGNFGDDVTHKELYKKVKDQTLNKVLDSLEGVGSDKPRPPTPAEIEKEYRNRIVLKNIDKHNKDIADILGVTVRTIQKIKKKIRESDEAKKAYIASIEQLPRAKEELRDHYINTPMGSENVDVPEDKGSVVINNTTNNLNNDNIHNT